MPKAVCNCYGSRSMGCGVTALGRTEGDDWLVRTDGRRRGRREMTPMGSDGTPHFRLPGVQKLIAGYVTW